MNSPLYYWWFYSNRFFQLLLLIPIATVLIIASSSELWLIVDKVNNPNNPEIKIHYFIIIFVILDFLVFYSIMKELRTLFNRKFLWVMMTLFISQSEILIVILISTIILTQVFGFQLMSYGLLFKLQVSIVILSSIVSLPILLGEITLSFAAKFNKQLEEIKELRKRRDLIIKKADEDIENFKADLHNMRENKKWRK